MPLKADDTEKTTQFLSEWIFKLANQQTYKFEFVPPGMPKIIVTKVCTLGKSLT